MILIISAEANAGGFDHGISMGSVDVSRSQIIAAGYRYSIARKDQTSGISPVAASLGVSAGITAGKLDFSAVFCRECSGDKAHLLLIGPALLNTWGKFARFNDNDPMYGAQVLVSNFDSSYDAPLHFGFGIYHGRHEKAPYAELFAGLGF